MIGNMRVFDKLIPNSLMSTLKESYHKLEYHKNNMFRKETEIFSQVEVETNSLCNRTCKICPNNEYTRGNHYMDLSTYQNLLDQLSDMDFSGRFVPVAYNEPLLDNRLEDLMSAAREQLPKATILIYTNGSKLTENRIESLSKAGVNGLIVSQYEDNLEKDDISDLLKSLPKELKKLVRHRILKDEHLLSTRAGLIEVSNKIIKSSCYQASNNIIIDYKGNIILCCHDYFKTKQFGNIHEKPVLDIWNDAEFKELRSQLRKGIFNLDMCKNCVE
jgi:radical SAM protein with 4Fe4S-binding SPASM domain